MRATRTELDDLRARAGREAAAPCSASRRPRRTGSGRRPGSPRSTSSWRRCRTRSSRAARERSALRAELDDALAGARDLASCLRAHRTRADAGRAALRAIEAAQVATRAAADAGSALARAVEDAGFPDADAARAALLDPAALRALDERVADHQRRLAAVRAVLDEPGAAQATAGPAPDLPALERAHGAALTELGTARSRAALWTTRATRLATLVAELSELLEEWAPLRESLELAVRLAGLAEGKSADNRLQMRLSAYVLAYRLAQVVAAANERLARMSDERYTLEHTGRRGAGETRGGLSLAVRDTWSGEARDPATLSGGETFVVSLALALGLADVITGESSDGAAGDSSWTRSSSTRGSARSTPTPWTT